MARTVVGLFDDFQNAQMAVEELERVGVPSNKISIIANDATGDRKAYIEQHSVPAAGVGANTGAVAGGVGGVLLGLGLLLIPGLGPLAAAGPLVAGLTGAGAGALTGAAVGGLVDALAGTGVPREDAELYTEGVRRGGTLVTVSADDTMSDQVVDILNRNRAVDVHGRADQYRETGYTGYSPNAQPFTADQIAAERRRYASVTPTPAMSTFAGTAPIPQNTRINETTVNRDVNTDINRQPQTNLTGNEQVLPVIEEQLQVGKRQVDRGGVRVYTHVTETPVQEQVSLHEERVNVERRPVDRPISNADMNAFKDQSFELRETAEEAVIAKQARVVEEVVVNKQSTDRTQTIEDTVRRTDVEVEQLPGNEHVSRTAATFDNYASDFRSNYQTNYGSTGGAYEQYEPAYRYGYDLTSNPRYQGQNWNAIENNVRTDWESRQPGTWDRFKNSVRYAWDKGTGAERGGIQTGGRAMDGSPDTRGIGEKIADAVTGDRIDDKTGKVV